MHCVIGIRTHSLSRQEASASILSKMSFLTVYWVYLEKKDEIASLFLDTFSSMWGGGGGSQIWRMKEGGKERAKFQTKKIRQQLVANNSKNSTVYTIRFADFFYTYSQGITYEVPTRYRADTGKDSVKSSQNFLFSRIVAVGPIRYRLRLHTVPTAIVMILPRTFPL